MMTVLTQTPAPPAAQLHPSPSRVEAQRQAGQVQRRKRDVAQCRARAVARDGTHVVENGAGGHIRGGRGECRRASVEGGSGRESGEMPGVDLRTGIGRAQLKRQIAITQ